MNNLLLTITINYLIYKQKYISRIILLTFRKFLGDV